MKNFNFSNPASKKEITKDFMEAYIYETKSQDKDEVKWYIDLCERNAIVRNCGLDGKDYKQYDYKAVRKEFVKRYFSYLNKKKSTNTSDTYLNRLKSLIA